MQPDDRVDQNELDAVLLNWLQVVDPASQGGAAAPAASSFAGERQPTAPAPLVEAALPSVTSNAEKALTVSTQSQDSSSSTETPIPRSVRDAAISAIARGRAGILAGRVRSVAASRIALSQETAADMDRGQADMGERDAAFETGASGGWLSTVRFGSPMGVRGAR
jgi:hypothetical protein